MSAALEVEPVVMVRVDFNYLPPQEISDNADKTTMHTNECNALHPFIFYSNFIVDGLRLERKLLFNNISNHIGLA